MRIASNSLFSASAGRARGGAFTPALRRRVHRSAPGPVLALAAALCAPAAFAQSQPANDNFANAIPLTSTNLTVVASNDYATKEPGEPDHAGNSGGKSVWWTWQAPVTGYVTLSTQGSVSSYANWPLDTLLAVYVGNSVSTLTEVASNDEDPATYYTSRLGFVATAGTLYRIAVDGYSYDTPEDADSGTIQLSLTVSGLAPNDNFAQAIELTGTNLTVTGNNDAASKEPGEPYHAWNAGGKSVWWSWRAPATGFVNFSTQGSLSSQFGGSLDALLAVYRGDSVSNLTPIAAASGTGANATFRVDAGKLYRIAVDGYSYDTPSDADSGNITLTLLFRPGLPLAPPWGPIPDLTGNPVQSTDFSGKVVILNFWATWCGPCVGETPDLVALYQKYAPDGLVIVGVSLDNSPDGVNPPTSLVSSFAANYGLTYPVLTDRPSWWAIEDAYGGIPSIPTTFVLNRQNQVWQAFVGSQGYSTFEQAILPLLYADLRLNLAFSHGQAHLSWPVTQATFVLESTPSLASGAWTPVPTPPQSDGVSWSVDLPANAGPQYFRLRLP